MILAFTINIDAAIKLKLLLIGKSQKPKAFRCIRVEHYVSYKHSAKAWLTVPLFN